MDPPPGKDPAPAAAAATAAAAADDFLGFKLKEPAGGSLGGGGRRGPPKGPGPLPRYGTEAGLPYMVCATTTKVGPLATT